VADDALQRPVRLFAEAMGLHPFRERMAQARIALAGEEDVPASKFGLSSLSQLRPRLGVPLWRGRAPVPRTVLFTNLFNHRQTPIMDGWSVKKTQVLDFRGRDLTYDSHNGTDLCIPIGTPVLAPAPAEVVKVVSEFNRGGLKIYLDHGAGLMTCSAHLARPLVQVGDRLRRGEPYAISGYSGLDALVTFPWGVPHVHFNTWLNGEPVDPFPHDGAPSLWRGDLPKPQDGPVDEPFAPSTYDADAVDAAIASCITASVRERLSGIEPLSIRAAELISQMNYYPTRFPERIPVYAESHPRTPTLDLPFGSDRFDGVMFVDDL